MKIESDTNTQIVSIPADPQAARQVTSIEPCRYSGAHMNNLCVELHRPFQRWTDLLAAMAVEAPVAKVVAQFAVHQMAMESQTGPIAPERAAELIEDLIVALSAVESECKWMVRHVARIRRAGKILRKRLLRGRALGKAIRKLEAAG